jgi:hypothetical protein
LNFVYPVQPVVANYSSALAAKGPLAGDLRHHMAQSE